MKAKQLTEMLRDMTEKEISRLNFEIYWDNKHKRITNQQYRDLEYMFFLAKQFSKGGA